MADSWDSAFGENDPEALVLSDVSLAAEDFIKAYVARDIYHVYDSDDADTSDEEYHEPRSYLQAYGEIKKRKVKAFINGHGEEVEQLDDFEEEESDDEDSEDDVLADERFSLFKRHSFKVYNLIIPMSNYINNVDSFLTAQQSICSRILHNNVVKPKNNQY
ncbi:unnamed protein product [Linum trigynum]|uniref:Uncharacterized protein n=1 Tax=Linum trigynum TaxID=586398 RepID=A0AAV2EAR7_9ROSI